MAEQEVEHKRFVIKVEEERVMKLITVDEFLAVDEGNLREIVNMVSKLLWSEDKHEYYEPAEARKMLGKLTMAELTAIGQKMRGELDEAAIPKGIEPESD